MRGSDPKDSPLLQTMEGLVPKGVDLIDHILYKKSVKNNESVS